MSQRCSPAKSKGIGGVKEAQNMTQVCPGLPFQTEDELCGAEAAKHKDLPACWSPVTRAGKMEAGTEVAPLC